VTALGGLTVLDFTHALAGPYCTKLLADYGADVYKIESPEGEIGRGWAPPFTNGEASYFLGINPGKRGVSIDLKRPGAVELCLRMIEKADVLVENLRIGTLERLGLGYRAASARNPRLVYCSISGYGQSGPAREQSAMDLILQASSGLISVTGQETGEVARCGHSIADITAGIFALSGILMALLARDRSGGAGQFVDVSMYDSMISAMSSNYANYAGTGIEPGPLGTAFATIVPYRTFPAADRELAMAVGSERLWTGFCRAIGRPDIEKHPDYATNALRVKNRGVLEPMLAAIFRGATAEEWMRRLSAEGVPCSPVRTLKEVTEDPQAEARGMFLDIEHPSAGTFPVTGPPVKFSATPGAVRRPAPRLGEHTREALADLLGLAREELDGLEARGVIVQAQVT
jgi:formyl-CoA transferase/CoA:oxalate CoA-transferase